MQIIDLKKTIIEDSDADGNVLRTDLNNRGVFYINIMSSPGSGKTTTLVRTLEALKNCFEQGVMEADIDSDVDALTVAEAGFPAVQLHTGGMCHLDADMSRQGMRALTSANGGKECQVVYLENVGNLVCPAEFDTGAHLNVVILSVPEGDDKPLKYPLMFEKCNVVLLNKFDSMPAFDFSLDKFTKNVAAVNPTAKIFPISAKTGEGFENWIQALTKIIQTGLNQ